MAFDAIPSSPDHCETFIQTGSQPVRTAFVLSGGGSCGAAQVGMLRALLENGLKPDLVVGTSVGAINGALFAADPTQQGIDRMEAIWRGIRREDVFPVSIRSLLRVVRGRESLVDPASIRSLLQCHFGSRRLEDSSIPTHVVATAVEDGSPVRLSKGTIVDALLASTAIPAVLPPVRIDGRLLIDGGVAGNIPILAALELGATRIVVLPTTSRGCAAPHPRNAWELGLHAMALMLARQAHAHLRAADGCVEMMHVPAVTGHRTNPFQFSGTVELIEAAAEQTCRWLMASHQQYAR